MNNNQKDHCEKINLSKSDLFMAEKMSGFFVFILILFFWGLLMWAGVALKIFDPLPTWADTIVMVIAFLGPLIGGAFFYNWLRYRLIERYEKKLKNEKNNVKK